MSVALFLLNRIYAAMFFKIHTGTEEIMDNSFWIFIVVAVFAVLAFISYMRRQIQKSKRIDKTIDYSKMRPWKEED